MAIVVCPVCQQKLRVPDGKRGTVTCPHCGAEWFHPETIELSEVEFRCSKSGARFNVISSRRSPFHKFVIQKINKAMDGASRPAEAEPLSSFSNLHSRPARPMCGLLPQEAAAGWRVSWAANRRSLLRPQPPLVKQPARPFRSLRTTLMNTIGVDFLVLIAVLPVLSRARAAI